MAKLYFCRQKSCFNIGHILPEHLIGGHQIGHGHTRVKHRSMVLSSYLRPDGSQRTVRYQTTAQVHGYLSCLNYLALARLGKQVVAGDIFAGNVEDVIDLPEKRYVINRDAFYNIGSYKMIAPEL